MPDLRPMEFGEILDGALSLYRRHFGLFFKLSLLVMWLPLALLLYWRIRFFGLRATPEQTVAVFQTEFVSAFGWVLAWGIAYGAAMLLLTAGSIRIISDSFLGREPNLGEALSMGVEKIVPLFLVGFGKSLLLVLILFAGGIAIAMLVALGKAIGAALAALLIFAGGVGLVWLFLYVVSGYMVTTPVVVLEQLPSAFDSFGRSWQLTAGAKLRMFFIVVVAWVIASLLPALVLQAIGALLLQFVPSALMGWAVVQITLPIILTPIIPCVLTFAYYDRRVRREGFDLQVLSEQLGVGLRGAS
jgi:hypothetical protein